MVDLDSTRIYRALVLAGAPHVIWSACAGAFLALLLSALQAQVAYRSRQQADHLLFYFLYLFVLMIGAGTIVHAIKGSTVYTIATPIMFDVVVAINLVVLAGCLMLTIASIFLAWLGNVMEKKKMLSRS
ncbi:MAG: hypothetical protein GYA24_00960 [Candidatus Lokiarchaeota archaeon]|nr:hypothetical protein [Candidatus Lokiarchaeota archaeon]